MASVDAGTIYSSIALDLAKLKSGVIKVNTTLDSMVKKSKSKAAGFGSFWKGAFQTAFGFGAIQIITKMTNALKNMVGSFSGFQQSMQNVKSVTQAVGVEFDMMTGAAKEAGETTRFTATQAADALYFLGSAGFSAAQSIAALDGVLQLAGATQSDLASTAESVAAIISQYSLEASAASDISNIFAAAIGNSQATMEKLSNAFRQVGPVAAGFGMSVEETTGALQELFNAGFKGQQAGRALKSALADLAAPTTNIKNIFGKLGIELSKVNPETNSLAEIIDVLGASGATTSDIIKAFGKVAGPQMAVLIKQGGASLREYTDAVTGTNAAAEAYEIQNDSLAGSLDFLKSKMEGVSIAIVGEFEPGMRDLIDSFIKFLEASKPVGEILGSIFNIIFKIASISTDALTFIFDSLLGSFKKLETPMEKANKEFEKVRKTLGRTEEIDKNINKIEKLTTEYENLTSKTELSEAEQSRLKKVIQELGKIVPEAATSFDIYGNAIDINTQKTKEAARILLETRKAIILEAKTRLELQEPILQGILRREKAEANRFKNDRERTAREANLAEQRIALVETFNLKYNQAIKNGEESTNAFIQVNEELRNQLRFVGITLETSGGKARILGQGFRTLNEAADDSAKAIDSLVKILGEESEVEIRVKDAEAKLKELADFEKELTGIHVGLTELKKIDPTAPKAEEKLTSLGQVSKEFWDNYRENIKKATQESSLFGDKQAVLKSSLDFLKSAYLELVEQGLDPTGETLTRIRQEYDLTLLALNAKIKATKDDIAATEKSDKAYQDILDIIEEYQQKTKDVDKTEREKAIALVEGMGQSEKATKQAIDAINEYWDTVDKKSGDGLDKFTQTVEGMISIAQSLANALIGLFSQMTDNRIEELDRQMEAELEAAGLAEETTKERLERELDEAKKAGDEETIKEKENAIARIEIEEEYERKKAKLQYDAALVEWGLQLAAATAALFKAIMVATAALPWPANLPAIGYAIASGVNVGMVAAAKPTAPAFADGGLFLGPDRSGPTGGSMVEAHAPEMFLNQGQMTNLFNMINSGGGSGGGVTVTNIIELDGVTIAKSVEKSENAGIIKFKQRKGY